MNEFKHVARCEFVVTTNAVLTDYHDALCGTDTSLSITSNENVSLHLNILYDSRLMHVRMPLRYLDVFPCSHLEKLFLHLSTAM